MKSSNFCIINIGFENDQLNEKIFKILQQKVDNLDVPFVFAEKSIEWINWIDRKNSTFGGIGSGAAGCLLAHRQAWLKLIHSHYDYALVLESDAKITKFGEKYLDYVLKTYENSIYSIMHLGNHITFSQVFSFDNLLNLSPRGITKEIWERVYLRYKPPKFANNQFPFSTHAYLIKKQAAEFLSNFEINFMAAIDVTLNSYSQTTRNNISRCRTPLFTQNVEQLSLTRMLGR